MAGTTCKLCHGPFTSAVIPTSPAIQSSASLQAVPVPEQVACHTNCLTFACPGCVAKDRPSYQILNLRNHIYDYHCGTCMAELPLSTPARPSTLVVATPCGPVVTASTPTHAVF